MAVLALPEFSFLMMSSSKAGAREIPGARGTLQEGWFWSLHSPLLGTGQHIPPCGQHRAQHKQLLWTIWFSFPKCALCCSLLLYRLRVFPQHCAHFRAQMSPDRASKVTQSARSFSLPDFCRLYFGLHTLKISFGEQNNVY